MERISKSGVLTVRYKMTLRLESPLLVGGKKQVGNYAKSMNYVPGGVVRAAFAKAILDRCSYEKDDRIVEFQDKEDCASCKLCGMCKSFSNMKFGFLYPLGSTPYPITNMRCKYDATHDNVDTLIFRINMMGAESDNEVPQFNEECPGSKKGNKVCKERLEKHLGFYTESDKGIKDAKVAYTVITKSAINPYLKSSKDGALYSLDAVMDKYVDDGELKPMEFAGYIDCDDKIGDELKDIETLRIGAYTNSGFGKCTMSIKKDEFVDNSHSMKQRIEEFNKEIRGAKNKGKTYIPIMLTSDAYLKLEECSKDDKASKVTTEEFIELYRKHLSEYVPSWLKLELPIVINDKRRGYDTSKEKEVIRDCRILTKMGSIFVFSAEGNIDYDELLKLESKGIGEHTEHGFGSISVCSSYYKKWAMVPKKEEK